VGGGHRLHGYIVSVFTDFPEEKSRKLQRLAVDERAVKQILKYKCSNPPTKAKSAA
jgi:hypothetical protein